MSFEVSNVDLGELEKKMEAKERTECGRLLLLVSRIINISLFYLYQFLVQVFFSLLSFPSTTISSITFYMRTENELRRREVFCFSFV